MDHFSIRRIDIGALHVSLVRNEYAASLMARGMTYGMWRVPRMTAITIHVHQWFLNVDWLR